MAFHPNQDKIVQILSQAEPNSNLMVKAQQQYDVSAQLAREQKFYNVLQNPLTGTPITNIRQLNELILSLDSAAEYGFSALLPNAPGGVEEYLSHKYNLRLVEKEKFSETEQERVKEYIDKNLVLPTIDLLKEHGFDFATSDRKIIQAIIAGMGAINATNTSEGGTIQIFTSFAQFREASRDLFGQNYSSPFGITSASQVARINFVYNLIDKPDGKVKMTLRKEINGDLSGFNIDGDLNNLTEATRKGLLEWARGNGLLDEERQSKAPLNPGGGTKAPGSATPEEWKTDVYEAVNKCLGSRYRDLMQLEKSEADNLFNKYQLDSEIALGRQLVNLRGFLGELRGILMIDAICPGAVGKLTGTSKVDLATKLSKSGQSAPLDLLVSLLEGINIGIQIKNTSEMDTYAWGNYRSSKGMPITSFYAERLQEDITDAERDFFGAYVYNQPINESTYTEVYHAFQGVFELFYWVYAKLALYIIRQETEIINSNDSLLSGTLKNDFFIMNDTIVPTSALYMALNEGTDLVESNFNFSTASKGNYSPKEPIPNNYINYAAQLTIKYSVALQYRKLLQSAYNIM